MKSFTYASLILAVVALSGNVYAQKKNETSAAVERNKVMSALAMENMIEAKKALLSAKEFIDLAAADPETMNSQKTLWLKGEIYSMMGALGMQGPDLELLTALGENGMDEAIAALKKGYPLDKKYAEDIITTVDRNRVALNGLANVMYNQGQFEAAGEFYKAQAEFADCINLLDTNAVFNAALCYERSDKSLEAAKLYEQLATHNYRGTACAVLASSSYRKAGDINKARAIIDAARKENPSDRELLLELVNTNIDAGDAAGAESALNAAIATDPNNKQLHYTIGTIYIDLKENAKAENALNKALEIDPNYVDAQYQLGAHLVTWAGNMSTEAKQLPFGDPNYNKMITESEELYRRALIPLEKYIANDPKDKQVLTILFQIQRNLGNSEKALEYKRRADEVE